MEKEKTNFEKESLKYAKRSFYAEITLTILAILITVIIGINQIPSKPEISFFEFNTKNISGEEILKICDSRNCTYRFNHDLQKFERIQNQNYISRTIAINNEGKATKQFSMIMNCNFLILAISPINQPQIKNAVNIIAIQSANYNSIIEVDELGLSDLIFLEIFQEKNNIENPTCYILYTTEDSNEKKEKINFT